MSSIRSVAVLVLAVAGLVRPVLAQEFDIWRSICSENQPEGTVCVAELATQFMRFKLTIGARGEKETARVSLQLSEGTLRYAQMKIDDDQATYDFVCLTTNCVLDSDNSQVAMRLFETAHSAVVHLTTARGGRIMMRFKLDGFADAVSKARAGT